MNASGGNFYLAELPHPLVALLITSERSSLFLVLSRRVRVSSFNAA
jgi:hypothetical protein